MSVNVELLERTLAHIESHEDQWEQRYYRCETGMCFAGWACQLAGGRWHNDADANWPDVLVTEPDDDQTRVFVFRGRRGTVARDRAQRLLGLGDNDASELFDSDNTLEDLRRIVADIKGGAS